MQALLLLLLWWAVAPTAQTLSIPRATRPAQEGQGVMALLQAAASSGVLRPQVPQPQVQDTVQGRLPALVAA